MKKVRLATIVLMVVELISSSVLAQEANYFESSTIIEIKGGNSGGGVDVDALLSPAGLYASVRTISVFCQFPLLSGGASPTGALVQFSNPAFGNGVALLIVPLSVHLADDGAASPFRYFAGTITPFLEIPSYVAGGKKPHLYAQTNANVDGQCQVSFYGVRVQRITP